MDMVPDLFNKINTLCFSGHRYLGEDFDEARFLRLINAAATRGFNTFICGGALGFDTYAAEAVLKLKRNFPSIKLHLYLPCNDQDSRWSAADRKRYRKILSRADYVDCPDVPYYDGCMRDRNYRMVDASSLCICYLNNDLRSGTAQTVRYALKEGLVAMNVSSDIHSVFWDIKSKYENG